MLTFTEPSQCSVYCCRRTGFVTGDILLL